MLMTFRQAQKQLVVTDAEKGFDPLGRFYDFVINPETGKCEALWIQSLFGLRILFLDDITRWQDEMIHIKSSEMLHKSENLPRLKNIFEAEVPIMHAKVWEGDVQIGRVKNFWFDTISPRIVKISVRNGWWFFAPKRIITSDCIESITEKGVTICESPIKVSDTTDDVSPKIKKMIQEPGMEKNTD
jgi:uncharacterized protein YrrD